jgi:hypothetical protein
MSVRLGIYKLPSKEITTKGAKKSFDHEDMKKSFHHEGHEEGLFTTKDMKKMRPREHPERRPVSTR